MKQPLSSFQTRHFFRSKIVRSGLLSVGVSLLFGMVFQFALQLDRNHTEAKNKSLVVEKALAVATQLESELNANVFVANGLGALVAAAPHLSHTSIQMALKVLHNTHPHLKNIALAPGNRISHIYPLAGNESALGLYYPEVPEQWVKVQESITKKSTVLAGPLPLRQGGTGLVSRTPVFMPNGDYWGILSLVVDANMLLEHAQQTAAKHGLNIALRGKDGRGAQGAVFWGNAAFFDTPSSTLLTLHIPGGTWQLAARPLQENPFEASNNFKINNVVAWIISGLMGILFFLYLRSRHRVNSSEKQLRAILETSPDGVVVINDTGTIEVFNPGAEAMFGYGAAQVLGKPVGLLMNREDARHHAQHLAQIAQPSGHYMAKGREIHGRHQDGSMFPIEVKVAGVNVEGRRLYVGILRDITERQQAQQKLLELATRDSLTGVFNRRAIGEFLQTCLTQTHQQRQPLSVLMLDADHFKSINDRFGHHVGDQVLIRLVALVNTCLRPGDTFGRMGGEEFLVVLPETNTESAIALAQTLLTHIAQTRVEVDAQVGTSLQFTVSIGCASLTEDTTTVEDLLKRADMALYRAKEQGRNRCVAG